MSAAESHWEGNQLFEIVALLASSGLFLEAIGAPAAPPAPAIVVVGEAPPAVTDWGPGYGPADPVTPLDRLQGIAVLDRLATLPYAQVRGYLSAHPETVAELLSAPPAASDVAVWWASSSAATRAAVVSAAPRIGTLEGMPYAVRDLANRTVLREAVAALDDRLDDPLGRAERDELETRRHMLAQIEQALIADDHRRWLVTLDVTGEGRAVIAVGDIAQADYVSYLVPGMFFGVDAQIVPWTDTAEDLVHDQERWLASLRPGEQATVAAVAWIGYRTPSLVNVASLELAREGRDAFTASLDGLRAARGADQPYLSVLAHSYGSTAVLLSLEEHDVTVDALAMVGSPGSPARSVSELGVEGGNVWVGAASWDPIPMSGVFGSQPGSRAYGAQPFSVAEGVDPLTGAALDGAVTHNDYFAEGGMSLRNLALIGIGEGARVATADADSGDLALASTRRALR